MSKIEELQFDAIEMTISNFRENLASVNRARIAKPWPADLGSSPVRNPLPAHFRALALTGLIGRRGRRASGILCRPGSSPIRRFPRGPR